MPTLPRLLTLMTFGLFAEPTLADEVSFTREVMAVLSRAGCNQGACHGNLNGKGGLKLSLRGEDPTFDWAVLTRDALGRRTNSHRPDESLLLLKAVAAMPHEGGRRITLGSDEYRMLRTWIAGGMRDDSNSLPPLRSLTVSPPSAILIEPANRLSLKVTARFADASPCDVTGLSAFESSNPGVAAISLDGTIERHGFGEATILVRYLDRQAAVRVAFVPSRSEFVWPSPRENNFIDRLVFAKLKSLRQAPSEVCDDGTFIRRLFLDILGVLPRVDETRAFLADTHPDKRDRLIDATLARPEFADYWALKWADLLRSEEKTLDSKGVQALHRWLRAQIDAGRPLNEFAADIIAARGSTYAVPAANFYRALRDVQARAETTAQVFLGVRLQCAKCHNHPFDRWTQNDYHQLAAFFGRVQYRVVSNNRRDMLDKHEFDGEQIVWMDRDSEVTHPQTGNRLSPKLPGVKTAPMSANADRLQTLADWVADPANPFFARVQANRVWYHLLGRGLVEPIDDFRDSNPAVNPPLLDALATEFRASDFDLRKLVRTIVASRTYQLSAVPNETNQDDDTNFARALVRPLEAEQLLDAITETLGVAVKFEGQPLGVRAGQLPGVPTMRPRGTPIGEAAKFLKTFGKPDRLLSCECERSDDTTLVQAFQLITGEMLNDLLRRPDNRLSQLINAGLDDDAIVETMYLAALSRPPSAKERQAAIEFVSRGKDRRAGLEDVTWALLNAKEFLLRR